jgi:DNA repair protein RadA/Sms
VARAESRFVCQACGEAFLRWSGQCRACEAWNTLVETVVRTDHPGPRRSAGPATGQAQPIALADARHDRAPRARTGIGELDRVLGDGLVSGSLVLLGGEPGVGKSTLLLQAAAGLAATAAADATGGPARVLVASGEESAAQVRLRAERLGLLAQTGGAAIDLLATSEVGRIAEAARTARPALVIVDSIQTMTVDELDGPAGSVGQVRESALRLLELAKGEGIAVVLVGHVTKDGSLAGPKTLEHLVDAVLELGGDRTGSLRVLRATKNRFGSTEEIGVFELGPTGLAGVADPARAFLVEHTAAAPGSVVAATLEGSRPLLVEVQALVAPAGFSTPARRVSGIDASRLAMLLAVLGRRAGIGLGSHDVYANLAGGLSVGEPGLDLAVALALASSARDLPIARDVVAVGEVGLLGELRAVAALDRRLREAARLGFRRAIVPAVGRGLSGLDIEVVRCPALADAIRVALGPGSRPRRPAAEPAPAEGGQGSDRLSRPSTETRR